MAIGVAGGHAIGVELLGVDAGSYWSQIRANVDIHDLLQSLLKSTVFGAVISWIAVYQGYNAAPTSEGDRKSVVQGESVSVRVDLGGRRILKKQIQVQQTK